MAVKRQITESSSHSSPQTEPEQQPGVDSLADRYRALHDLLTDSFADYQSHALAYLQTGMQFFRSDAAILCKFSNQGSELEVIAQTGDVFRSGESINPDSDWCDLTRTQKKVLYVSKSDGISECMSYNGQPVCTSLCVPIVIAAQDYGLLCFFVGKYRERNYSNDDISTAELMAKGVAKMIELHKKLPETQIRGRSEFATEGVKSFQEYVEEAALPEVYGVAGRVVEILQARIGKAPLSIDHIADEMNLSKRTLQRRLQQQGISFAELRDQVRFHHSINYLVENVMSIDSISTCLDFSDRTSFTNAFKRWTTLSPSTFRKLFRDYV